MEQWYATGKRKTAVARVFLRPGKGEIVVNGKNTKDYFYTDSNIMKIDAPLAITKTQGKFDILVTVCAAESALRLKLSDTAFQKLSSNTIRK